MAVDSLVEHRPFVVRLCRLLLRNSSDAEDAAQQVFLNAYRALRTGVQPVQPRAWLAQIARNECRSRARRQPESPLLEETAVSADDPAALAAEHAFVERLREELADLPERQRKALLLREFRGLSYNEVAAQMDETGPAVESLLQRARRRLALRLEDSRRAVITAVFARLLAGGGATETVATTGTAAVVGRVAAAGMAAVALGSPSDDVHRALSPPAPLPARHVAQKAEVVRKAVVVVVVGAASRPRHLTPVVHRRTSNPGPSVQSPQPTPPLPPPEPAPPETRVDNSGPDSLSSGPGSIDNSGHGSSNSGPGSGSGDD